jgi:hypothetical protein
MVRRICRYRKAWFCDYQLRRHPCDTMPDEVVTRRMVRYSSPEGDLLGDGGSFLAP